MNHGLEHVVGQSTPVRMGLPVEIRFLLNHGFTFDLLSKAAFVARKVGVSPEILLFAVNLIEQEAYYRALAQELGLPFTLSAPLSESVRFPESLRAGMAPLLPSAGAFLLAPRGERLGHLLAARRHFRPGVLITTPDALQQAVLKGQARSVAHRASNELAEWRPDFSVRDQQTSRQIATLITILVGLVASTSLGPSAPLIALSLAASPIFVAVVATRLAASFLGDHPQAPTLPPMSEAELPTYTIIVALSNEGRVVPQLVAALNRMHYPRSKLDIKFVIEADDDATLEALRTLRLPSHMDIIAAPAGYPRTKPRALNVALPLARGELVVVYDAEDVPDPHQLRLAAAAFKDLPPEVACLQARLTIDNTRDSWLTRLFTIEYAALFDVVNPGLAALGSPMLLGGTSNHFRTRTLRAVRGWDPWNVTEDADLGIRLARLGYEVVDLPSSTFEEAPIRLGAWMRQRTRWMKGFIQTCVTHSRHPLRTFRELGFWRGCGALAITLGTVLSALGYPFFTGLLVAAWLEDVATPWSAFARAFGTTLFILGLFSIYAPAIMGLSRRKLWSLLPWTLMLPVYYLLISVAAWRALWENATAPHRWNKTAHGLARTTRRSLRSTRREPKSPSR